MRNDTKLLLTLSDGTSLVTSAKQDEYWLVNTYGERTKLTLQAACQVWLRNRDSGAEPRSSLFDVPQPPQVQHTSNLVAPPPIPPDALRPVFHDPEPDTDESRESWHASLMRKLGVSSQSIEAMVEADRKRFGG